MTPEEAQAVQQELDRRARMAAQISMESYRQGWLDAMRAKSESNGATPFIMSPPVVETPTPKIDGATPAGDATPTAPPKRRGRPPKAKPAEPAAEAQQQSEPEPAPPAERADRRQVMAINRHWAMQYGGPAPARAKAIAARLELDQPTDSGDLTPEQADRLLSLWVTGDTSSDGESSE